MIPSNDTNDYVSGDVRDFSPEGFSFESKNIKLGTNETIRTRFKLVSESEYISVLGIIIWKIQIGDDSQVGVEIRKVESIVESENLGYPFNMWRGKILPRS